MNFQPWFGSVVVCYLAYHVDGNALRQRTRDYESSFDRKPFAVWALGKPDELFSDLGSTFRDLPIEALEVEVEKEGGAAEEKFNISM